MARLVLVATLCAALPVLAGGRDVAAAEVAVAVGFSVPPYVIADERRGMEYDIVKAALAIEGHVMRPNFLPAARAVRAIEAGEADAALTQHPENGVSAHYSDVHISFHNAAITLASRGASIERMEDLAGKSVVAFPRAATYLGPSFRRIVAASPGYREEARQTAQPILLYLGRAEVVVADPAVFAWLSRHPEVRGKADTSQPVRIHHVFPPTEYRVAFRDPQLRDSFNRGLARLRQSGEYARIVAGYAAPPDGDRISVTQ
ncbi:ABC transporter substrate-binding protein [Magnetospirillum sp. SS-4]|uniref:substrate-binding periplasmic protein n=1 Tax=Magnetospirillum sp. SS-4 TaxID=2681465 RepID=UPI001384B9E3